MDTAVRANAGVHGGCLAASVDGDEGWWRDRMPSGKRAVSLVEVIERGGRAVGALQRQEPIGQETQRRMVVEPRPRATLEVIQSQLLLELLIALLHLPARFPQADRFRQGRGRWQVGQRVADRTIGPPLDQQPARFGGRVGQVISRAAHAPAMGWPDAHPGKLGLEWSLGALSPAEWRALERLGQPLDRHRRRGVGRPIPTVWWVATA